MHLWVAVLMAILASIQGADDCRVTFEKVGCFKDNLANRRLPDLLITDRDPTDTEKFGKLFDWNNFQGSVRSLLCRCSSKARSLGYRYIGIQFYAECWTGHSYLTAVTDGPSKNCTQSYDTFGKEVCNFDRQDDCVGMGYTNFIYELLDCSEMVDVAVLLDVSTSMGENGLTTAKQLLKELVDLLHISRQGTHISLVTFTQTAKLEFDFTSHYNKGEDIIGLKSYIDGIHIVGGSTWPDTALDIANEDLFVGNGGRDDVPKFVITITDGYVHRGSIITPVMRELKGKGVNLLSVGVGLPNKINTLEVGYLAFSDQQNVFDGNDQHSAENIAQRIQSLAKDECSSSQAVKR